MISAALLAVVASILVLGPAGLGLKPLLYKVVIAGVTYGVTQVSLDEFCNT